MSGETLLGLLRAEFERRKNRNKAYSLRCFSRDLDLDPSNLSKIFKGKRGLSSRQTQKIAKRLGYENSNFEKWLSSGDLQDQSYHLHDLRVFQVVSDWQHYAILELFKIKGFIPTPDSIAQALGVGRSVAQESLKRLLDVKLLERDCKTKQLRPTDSFSSSITSMESSVAHRNQQRQILEAASQALEEVPLELRSQSSMTFAIDSRKIPEAKELIKKFRRKLGRLMSTSDQLDEVYQLSISLYPLTKGSRITQKKEKKV